MVVGAGRCQAAACRSRSGPTALLYLCAVQLPVRPVGPCALSFRFSGGLAIPGESIADRLTRPYDVPAVLGVQDQPHVSTAVVSTALASPALIPWMQPADSLTWR
jgi:hypothetical protein